MRVNPSQTINELITILAYVNDIDESRKLYHSHRVAILSAYIAKSLVSANKRREIFYGAVLHDIGGVGYPYHIIHYLRKNNKENRNILLSHPLIGAQLVSTIPKLTPVAKLILDHHEWANGQGYPRGKTLKFIPLGSQIIRIADSIDIAIQTGRIHNLNNLKIALEKNIDKEYSKNLFNHSIKVLKQNGLLADLLNKNALKELFDSTQEKIGIIRVSNNIDAIGTTMEVIAQVIDMKHPYTAGHSQRVSHYAMAIALAMNMSHDAITKIKWAGLIHDIGKLHVPRRILDKPNKLSKKEFRRIKEHAVLTEKLLNMVSSLKAIAPIASAHHERFDGTGYPKGLKAEQIPLEARILSVCDAFDAMTSNRPYKITLSQEQACRELEKYAGTQFDPEIIKQAIPLFKNLGL